MNEKNLDKVICLGTFAFFCIGHMTMGVAW